MIILIILYFNLGVKIKDCRLNNLDNYIDKSKKWREYLSESVGRWKNLTLFHATFIFSKI